MYYIEYKIITKAPVIMSSFENTSNVIYSNSYITGSSILGLFANNYIAKKDLKDPHNDTLFYNWFLNGDIRFGNAYLLLEDNKKTIPTPFYVQKIKGTNKLINIFMHQHEDAKPIKGYSFINNKSIIIENVIKNLSFHHKRSNRIKGHSTDGEIFYYESIQQCQTFCGKIIGSQNDLQEFRNFFNDIEISWLGKSRNAQYGKVQLFLNDIKSFDFDEMFNNDYNLEKNEYVISCLSPIILHNSFGYPDSSVKNFKKHLEHLIGSKINIKQCFTSSEIHEQFVSVWKLKKPMEKTISAGSTFFIEVINEFNNDSLIKSNLIKLIEEGIGEYKNEGFGQVMIEMYLPDEYYNDNRKKVRHKKPNGEIPKILIDILSDIIRNNVLNEIKNEAFRQAREFKYLPSNHLLGRLISMLSNANSIKVFVSDLNKLKERATSGLMKCRSSNKTLKRYIEDYENYIFNVEIKKIIYNSDYKKIFEIINYDLVFDFDFKEKLCKESLLTLFRSMRKLNKLEVR